ncbi:hypothetical protein G7084_05445 [Weissella coleopterorum]|uniref:Uncharacterized protein n=1 Tax=Weissella coleopterorum TaxID=2714949 RepID=A0A6G8B0R5_9LACO|nr:hypothetical protein [Weissella coleopterorum]QIL50805.1 hypothetical protein G7084_05445 [Weissella coleopterorum]
MLKKSLGIIQILSIIMIGLIIGAYAERSHFFGYSDNTPILPSGTYNTTSEGDWSKVTVTKDHFITTKNDYIVVDNRFTNKVHGRIVIAAQKGGNISKSYYVTKIKEGWRLEPIINGKPSSTNVSILYIDK